jgi:hypothetical protein
MYRLSPVIRHEHGSVKQSNRGQASKASCHAHHLLSMPQSMGCVGAEAESGETPAATVSHRPSSELICLLVCILGVARPSTRVVGLCIRLLLEAASRLLPSPAPSNHHKNAEISPAHTRLSRRTFFPVVAKKEDQKGHKGTPKEGERKKFSSHFCLPRPSFARQ